MHLLWPFIVLLRSSLITILLSLPEGWGELGKVFRRKIPLRLMANFYFKYDCLGFLKRYIDPLQELIWQILLTAVTSKETLAELWEKCKLGCNFAWLAAAYSNGFPGNRSPGKSQQCLQKQRGVFDIIRVFLIVAMMHKNRSEGCLNYFSWPDLIWSWPDSRIAYRFQPDRDPSR
jgi:hypothetical protein